MILRYLVTDNYEILLMNKKCIGRQAQYVPYEEIPSVFFLQWRMTKYYIDFVPDYSVTQ